MKEIIKKRLGVRTIKIIKDLKELFELPFNFFNDFYRYAKHASIGYTGSDKSVLLYLIIKDYHRIEKGMALPEPRLGFGLPVIKRLQVLLDKYVALYGHNNHTLCAVKAITCYRLFHESVNYNLSQESLSIIEKIESLSSSDIEAGVILRTKEDIFKFSGTGFYDFSRSRCSLRNFTGDKVGAELVKASVRIAQTAPSVCNRQAIKAYYYNDKTRIAEILATQNGNAGFGQTCGGVIMVTADLMAFEGSGERNQAFVDGGLFLMALLYGLHENRVGACALNWSAKSKQDKKLRRLTGLHNSEVVISLIGVGIPKPELLVACSPRTDIEMVYFYES